MRPTLRNRLRFETLERRDLLAVVRLAAWNAFNGPNDAADDADFSTILEAIGNETVAGNTKRVDILALQETDPEAGGNSISRLENVFDALYPSTDYATAISGVDGGGDSTGFVYDTTTVSLLEAIDVAPESLTHTILRSAFRPADTMGESDFYVYSVHLKSGTTSSNKNTRGVEAALLRSDADLLGEGAAVLFVGDFNMKDSFEAAHTNLSASGAAQLQDVAAAPGDWSDNIAFKSLHTQSPQAAMDDRFDLQFASGEFFDGMGIEYVDDSFHVFGNDGSHTLNGAITSGTGADPAVLTALFNASDHLPIVADYEIIPSVPLVRIRETGAGTQVIEGGLYDTYSVVLDTVPTQNVTVTVSPDTQIDLGFTTELLFTPSNALTPQTIVVDAQNDLIGEGDHSGLITHAVASLDADYDGLSVANVTVDIVDDDAPTIVINEVDADTSGIDSLEFVELYDGGVGNRSLSGKTLVFFNGATDTAYQAIDLTGQSTNSDGLFVVGNSAVAEVDLTFANDLLQNGADAVALYEGAYSIGAGVTTSSLLDAIVYDTDDGDDVGLLPLLDVGQQQLNENGNGNKDNESLARVPDSGTLRQTDNYVTRLPTPGQLNAPPQPGVLILQSGTRVDVAEGETVDSYQIALDNLPAASVTITVDPDDQTDLGAGIGVAIMLSFTAANALVPQTVLVTAVDDNDVEGDHSSVITHTVLSADQTYDGLAVGNVVANISDNEATIIPSIVISEIMYNPDSEESEPGSAEWIEIVNTGPTTIDIGDWRFDDEDATDWGVIPQGTSLAPRQAAVFFDTEFTDAATFRNDWAVPAPAHVIGIDWGSLANAPSDTNEILELLDDLSGQQDIVNFDDANGWPSDSPDGASIYLIDLSADNNVASNWAAAVVGVDDAISPTGSVFSAGDSGSPGVVPSSGDFDGDQDVDGADFLAWQRGFGSLYEASDLTAWQSEYGQGLVTPLSSLSVQETVAETLSADSAAELIDLALAAEWFSDDKEEAKTLAEDYMPLPTTGLAIDSDLQTSEAENYAEETVAPSQIADEAEVDFEPWLAEELLDSDFSS